MAARIKICGISDPDALEAAIEARADHCGFVFFPPSPRHLSPDRARSLAAAAEGRIARVGLFVDAGDGDLAQAIASGGLDALQLHGREDPRRVAEIRSRFGLPVWKVVPVAAREDIAAAGAFVGAADLILFDAKTPKDAALPGGMGLRFDWTLLAGRRFPLPWGLAGGLTPANVAEAIRVTGAPLVDTSSGVEVAPGRKDPARIAAFCTAARAA